MCVCVICDTHPPARAPEDTLAVPFLSLVSILFPRPHLLCRVFNKYLIPRDAAMNQNPNQDYEVRRQDEVSERGVPRVVQAPHTAPTSGWARAASVKL